MAEDDGFLSRWARRKAQAKQGMPVAPAVAPAAPSRPASAAPVTPPPPPAPAPVAAATAPAVPPPPPTLDDVAALTKESDYSRFVSPDVDPSVKNAAMKKLFASDPHFNAMDGLDVYIDDYNKFEPIPKSILRQLVAARTLGLLDDELEEQPQPASEPANEALPPTHEDADLQLQPDDAAGQPGAGQGVADGGPPADAVPDPLPPRSA